MSFLADARAVSDSERSFPQHQAALTLLQGFLADPTLVELKWLDLACGQGQLLQHIEENLVARARAKLVYFGFDLDRDNVQAAERRASGAGLKNASVEVGDARFFSVHYPADLRFDFITLTNTVHEIAPESLAQILFDCFCRLSARGRLFLYDMEQLPELELGAIPLSMAEVERVLTRICISLGMQEYVPPVGRWRHKSCAGWNAQVARDYLLTTDSLLDERREVVIADATAEIRDLLRAKLDQSRAALEALTRFGAQTEAEERDKHRLLFDFWALDRAVRSFA